MEPAAQLNYYEELEVSKSATQQEILTAYRRLASIYHPSRNLTDLEAATAKFQRLSKAYETLSVPDKRVNYDSALMVSTGEAAAASTPGDRRPFAVPNVRAFPRSFHVPHINVSNNEETFFYRDPVTGQYVRVVLHHPDATAPTTQPLFRGDAEEAEARTQSAAVEAAAAKERRKRAAAAEAEAEKERRQRLAAERREKLLRKAALKAAREAAKAMEKLAIEKQLEADGKSQKALWLAKKATTVEQKQATCLHAIRLTKAKQNQKLKCQSCGQKRGIYGFECPYCEIMVCQLCQTHLLEEKKKKQNQNQ